MGMKPSGQFKGSNLALLLSFRKTKESAKIQISECTLSCTHQAVIVATRKSLKRAPLVLLVGAGGP